MAKYINPFTDAGFKRIFGQEENKELLIAFLNHLFAGKMKITDVQYMDKESMPCDCEGRNFLYDIYCTIDTGEHIIVEMQNSSERNFAQRSLLYAARALDRQTHRSNTWNYRDLKAVIVISFLNFKMNELPERLLVDGCIIDSHTGKQINSFLRLIYIQIPFMTKALDECTDDFERWIYLLKNVETMDTIPESLRSQLEEIQRFEDVMNEASLSPEDRIRYERSLDSYRLAMDVRAHYVEVGEAKGREEGEAKGREEGRAEATINIARNFKQAGVDISLIIQATGLTADEIERL